MFTVFICTNEGCINKDVEYRLIDASPITICGGCKEILDGTVEEIA